MSCSRDGPPSTTEHFMLLLRRAHFLASSGRRGIAHVASVDGVPAPGAFSRATIHGGLVYVSGTGASDDDTGKALDGNSQRTAFDETKGALANIEKILHATGSATESIVNAQMLLTSKDDYAECNRAYVEFFAERGLADKLPARSSALWAVPTSAKVAFSVVAVVPDSGQ